MAALQWDKTGERLYETGTKNVALYVMKDNGTYDYGVAWNGVTGITESPSGAEATDLWADDRKYATMRSAEQLGGTITAYMYPDAWKICDGSANISDGIIAGQQARRMFALAFVSTIGNDIALNDYGEKLHIIYGCTANPSERAYATINDSPSAIEFSWEFTTTPIEVPDYKPMCSITIDSKKCDPAVYDLIKSKLFGSGTNIDTNKPTLMLPADIIAAAGSGVTYTYVDIWSDTPDPKPEPDDWGTAYINYYTRSGAGTDEDPYVYTQLVAGADHSWIATDSDYAGPYFEKQISTT